MSKTNDRKMVTMASLPFDETEFDELDKEIADDMADDGSVVDATPVKTPEELLAAADRMQAEADQLRKAAEEAKKAAEAAAKKAAEAAQAEREAAEKAKKQELEQAKKSGKICEAWLPKMPDGTLGYPYASPSFAEQASPIGVAEKRLCWGTAQFIGEPLTPEEMAAVYGLHHK